MRFTILANLAKVQYITRFAITKRNQYISQKYTTLVRKISQYVVYALFWLGLAGDCALQRSSASFSRIGSIEIDKSAVTFYRRNDGVITNYDRTSISKLEILLDGPDGVKEFSGVVEGYYISGKAFYKDKKLHRILGNTPCDFFICVEHETGKCYGQIGIFSLEGYMNGEHLFVNTIVQRLALK